MTNETLITTIFLPMLVGAGSVIAYLFHRLEKSSQNFTDFLRDERAAYTESMNRHTEASAENKRLIQTLIEREEGELTLLLEMATILRECKERKT